MKRFAIAAVTFVALVALLIAALPFVIPGSFLRDLVSERLATWTGRIVAITGQPRISIYPELTITIDGVTLLNPPEIGDESFVTIDTVRVQMEPLPLLAGRVQFTEFELVRPRFRFVVLKDGGSNWDLSGGSIARMAVRAVTRAAEAAASGDPAATSTVGQATRLGRLTILDGTVLYDDLASDRREEIAGLNADVQWPLAAATVALSGGFTWRGEALQFRGSVKEPLQLLGGNASEVRIALAATTLRAAFTGKAQIMGGGQRLAGAATLSTPSLRRTLTWLGSPMEPAATLGMASISGALVWDNQAVSFDTAKVELDGNQATGSLSFAAGTVRPLVRGALDAERLDLTAYTDAVRSDIASAGPWPIAPTRLPFADVLDVELDVTADQVVAGPARIGDFTGTAVLAGGRIELDVDSGQLYGGTVSGQARAAMSGEDLVFSIAASAKDVPARAALIDIAGVEGLDGIADVRMTLAGRGATWGEFARSLAGDATVALASGSLAQDLPAIAAALGDPLAEPFEAAGGSTPFASLSATVKISGGILASDDLRLAGSAATASLAGTGSLVTGLVEAQGTVAAGGISAPVAISGSWLRPVVARTTSQMDGVSAGIRGSGG